MEYRGKKQYFITPRTLVAFPYQSSKKGSVRGSSSCVVSDTAPYFISIRKKNRLLQPKFKNSFNSEKKVYTLNKSKVRDKLWAFFNLQESRRFGGFWSVSFPMFLDAEKTIKLDEDFIFELWHNFLVNLRKTYKLTDYLWVTEYQKNGQLHFHLCVNKYMPITAVNRSMQLNLKHKGVFGWEKYNGVDVEFMRGGKRKIMSYITKYVTKAEFTTFKHLPWHCSRLISRLFTKVEISEERANEFMRIWKEIKLKMIEGKTFFSYEHCKTFVYNQKCGKKWVTMPEEPYKLLMLLNNNIAVESKKKRYISPQMIDLSYLIQNDYNPVTNKELNIKLLYYENLPSYSLECFRIADYLRLRKKYGFAPKERNFEEIKRNWYRWCEWERREQNAMCAELSVKRRLSKKTLSCDSVNALSL